MIGSLRGRVLEKFAGSDRTLATETLLEVNGVGYEVTMTPATLDRLPSDTDALVYIHHHIREADQKLFGFSSLADRAAFRGLLGAHGVGPALALAVLATHPGPQLERILAEDDLSALCEVPGVGKKTAQRLLVELRSTLVIPEDDSSPPAAGVEGETLTVLGDVRSALVNLGYTQEEIQRATADLSTDAQDSGSLLKQALRSLAG